MHDPRDSQRLRRNEDKWMIFRMAVAAGAVLMALTWPFFHAYIEANRTSHPTGVDWHGIAFWTFCAVIFLAVTYPETKGFTGKIVSGIAAYRTGRKSPPEEE